MAGLLQGAKQNAENASLDDPALESAIMAMGSRLYEEGLGDSISEQVAKSLTSVPRIMATIAYKLAESSDVDTDGEIKEENLSVLGMMALNEVFEIAEASGVETSPADVSAAFKHMVIMFAQDQGLPPEQVESLANAMAQVDDRGFAEEANQVPDQFFEELPEEDVPVGALEEDAAPQQAAAPQEQQQPMMGA